MNRVLLPAFLSALLAPMAASQAGAPMRTDDPRTPGDGKFELNIAFDFERQASDRSFHAPILDLDYGLGERVQLNAQVPWLHIDRDDNPADRTLGRTEAGVKVRYLGDTVRGWSMSSFPRVAFDTPGRDPRFDEGLALRLPSQLAWQGERLGVSAEFGYEWVESSEDAWTAGFAAELAFSDYALLAELHADFDEHFARGIGIANVGVNVPVSDARSILFAAGSGVDLGADSELEWALYAAFQLRF